MLSLIAFVLALLPNIAHAQITNTPTGVLNTLTGWFTNGFDVVIGVVVVVIGVTIIIGLIRWLLGSGKAKGK